MIGPCQKDLYGAMEAEHYSVTEGFGQSDKKFTTSSYRVETTPKDEWDFVVGIKKEAWAGIDKTDRRDRGNRQFHDPDELLENAAAKMTTAFKEKNIDRTVTADELKAVGLRREEVIAMRLYTVRSAHLDTHRFLNTHPLLT